MAAFILSDEVLEELKCSVCKKYLSVKPVKVFPDNQIKCGRCTQPGDNGTVSLYSILAEESLFKCINRFDGCKKLLTYHEVQRHEQECLSNSYLCPICGQTEEFATYLLFDHFQTQHPNACLGKPEVPLHLSFMESEQIYFYKQYDCLFIINVIVSQIDDIVSFNVSFIGKEAVARKILHRLSIYSAVNRRIIHATKRRPCNTVGKHESNTFVVRYSDMASINRIICKLEMDTLANASLTVLQRDNIKTMYSAEQLEERLFPSPVLSEDFKIKYPDYSISDCGRFLKENKEDSAIDALPLFCVICYGKLSKVFSAVYKLKETEYLCGMCGVVLLQGFPEKFVPHYDIYKGISLTCRWGCGFVNGVNHNCKNHPPRICPLVDCQYVGTLDELVLHFQERHKLTYMGHRAHFFSNEMLEAQSVILLILNRFVILDVDVTDTLKKFTIKVIDKQYDSTMYIPAVVVRFVFSKHITFKYENFFEISKYTDICFCVTLRE